MLLLLPDRFLVPTSATPNLSSENLKHNLYKGSPSLGLTFIDLNNQTFTDFLLIPDTGNTAVNKMSALNTAESGVASVSVHIHTISSR